MPPASKVNNLTPVYEPRETEVVEYPKTGRRFTVNALDGMEGMRAERFASMLGFSVAYARAVFATVAIDDKTCYPKLITNPNEMEARLKLFKLNELDFMAVKYDQMFGVTADELKNELTPEHSQENSAQ